MRDLHFDGDFLRDFNAASKRWDWANWHKVRTSHDLTAQRLLDQVFANDDKGESGEGASEDKK